MATGKYADWKNASSRKPANSATLKFNQQIQRIGPLFEAQDLPLFRGEDLGFGIEVLGSGFWVLGSGFWVRGFAGSGAATVNVTS